MNSIRRFSLPALMLTTLAASAMSVAVAPQSAEAFLIRRRDADAFNNKYAKNHYVRGKCSMTKGKIFIPVPTGVAFGRQIPGAGEVKCKATVHKRKRSLIRLRRTRKLNVKRYSLFVNGDKARFVANKKSRTCNGKSCTVKIKPSSFSKTTGFTACIESRGKSRIIQVGTVPSGLDRGFKAKRCSQRKY